MSKRRLEMLSASVGNKDKLVSPYTIISPVFGAIASNKDQNRFAITKKTAAETDRPNIGTASKERLKRFRATKITNREFRSEVAP